MAACANFEGAGYPRSHSGPASVMLHAELDALTRVPAKWVRLADKDMRQHENLRRFPVILDHSVIQYDRETP